MRTDRLARLLQIRQRAATEAKQALADSLAAETRASRTVEAATATLALEVQAALVEATGDGVVEAYIRWLPSGRRALARANLDRDRAMDKVELARAALASALSAERAAEQAMEKTMAAEFARRSRHETASLDEIGRGRSGA